MISDALTKPVQLFNTKVVTPPSVEPVSLEEVKAFNRIDSNDEDTLIQSFIEGSRQKLEDYLGKALIKQLITVTFDEWVTDVIELPRPPLLSVVSIVTIDEDSVETIYASSNYFVVPESSSVVIKQGSTWPVADRSYSGYRIYFYAGYGETAKSVPAKLRLAIMEWSALWYESRILEDIPESVKARLRYFRKINI